MGGGGHVTWVSAVIVRGGRRRRGADGLKGGREGGRVGGRDGGRDKGRGRVGGREDKGREGGREGEGGRDGGRDKGREGGREGGTRKSSQDNTLPQVQIPFHNADLKKIKLQNTMNTHTHTRYIALSQTKIKSYLHTQAFMVAIWWELTL